MPPTPTTGPASTSQLTPTATIELEPSAECRPWDARQYPEDCLGPEAMGHYQASLKLAAQHDMPGALEQIKAAHGGTSGHLEATTGLLITLTGETETARTHFLQSIEVRDDGMHRVLWAMRLEEQGESAEAQAQRSLDHPRHEELGFNTHAEAPHVLAKCAWSQDRTEQGEQHMSEAYRPARETGYDFAKPDSSRG